MNRLELRLMTSPQLQMNLKPVTNLRPLWKNRLRYSSVFMLFIVFSVLFGVYLNVFRSELSGESDEPAHYITALLVRDYLAHGLRTPPFAFASAYYFHYPKIGIGHWPPLFYILQAAFMFIFGDSRAASLLLVLTTSSALAFLIYRTIVREFRSEAGAIAIAALYLCIPVVQMYERMIMADMLVALFSFGAMLCWADFMATGRRRPAIQFALLMVAAVLTKGNGYALMFVPPLAILLSRRWRLIANANLWLAGLITAGLTIPWTVFTRHLVVSTWQRQFGMNFFVQANSFYLSKLFLLPGLAIALFALIGLAVKAVIPILSASAEPLWVSGFAFLISNQLFHSLVPAGLESRYLLGSLAVLLLFMAAGIESVASWIPILKLRNARWVLLAVVLALFFYRDFSVPRKRSYGFDEAAQDLLANPAFIHSRVLCSSEGDGEGLFISEIAARDKPRPNHVIVRASQVLARMGWNGENYRLLAHSPQDVEQILAAIPAGFVVVDRTPQLEHAPHQKLLLDSLGADPNWRLIHVYPNELKPTTAPGARIEVYQWIGAPRTDMGRLRLIYDPTPKIVIDGQSAY